MTTRTLAIAATTALLLCEAGACVPRAFNAQGRTNAALAPSQGDCKDLATVPPTVEAPAKTIEELQRASALSPSIPTLTNPRTKAFVTEAEKYLLPSNVEGYVNEEDPYLLALRGIALESARDGKGDAWAVNGPALGTEIVLARSAAGRRVGIAGKEGSNFLKGTYAPVALDPTPRAEDPCREQAVHTAGEEIRRVTADIMSSDSERTSTRATAAAKATGKAVQPAKTLDELYVNAAPAQEELRALVEGLASKLGGEAIVPRELKKRARAEERLSHVGGPSRLFDISRATLALRDVTALYAALDAILDRPDLRVVAFSDRMRKPLAGCYRDILLNLRMSNGHVSELQLTLSRLAWAKESGHLFYEHMRKFWDADEATLRSLGGSYSYFGAWFASCRLYDSALFRERFQPRSSARDASEAIAGAQEDAPGAPQ